MSRILYKDIPLEIKAKIKELSENKYDEEKVGRYYDSHETLDRENTFSYYETCEGFAFWAKVMGEQKFDKFFEKYPKSSSDSKEDCFPHRKRLNEKEGTRYIATEKHHSFCKPGDIIILDCNDGSRSPRFRNDKNETFYYFWGYLKPIAENTINTIMDFIEGEKYPDEVEGTIYRVKSGYCHVDHHKEGDAFILIYNDGSRNPNFRNSNNGKTCYFSWHKLERIVQEVESVSSTIEDRPHPEEILGTEYEVISTTEKEYYNIGDIVKFYDNDNSRAPQFYNKTTEKIIFVPWIHLKRITPSETLSANTLKKYRYKTKEEFGGKFPIGWVEKMSVNYGRELTEHEVKMYEAVKVKNEKRFFGEEWYFNVSDVIEINNETILNLNIQHGKESSTYEFILHRVPPAVTYGTAPRGTAVSCPRSKICLGS